MLLGKLMNYYTHNKPLSPKRKLLLFLLVCLLSAGMIYCIIYFISLYDRYEAAEILKNPVYTTGVVAKKRSYKGKGMDIEYFVNKEPYILSTGVSTETYRKYNLGDEIEIVYNKLNPSQAMLKDDLKSNK